MTLMIKYKMSFLLAILFPPRTNPGCQVPAVKKPAKQKNHFPLFIVLIIAQVRIVSALMQKNIQKKYKILNLSFKKFLLKNRFENNFNDIFLPILRLIFPSVLGKAVPDGQQVQ